MRLWRIERIMKPSQFDVATKLKRVLKKQHTGVSSYRRRFRPRKKLVHDFLYARTDRQFGHALLFPARRLPAAPQPSSPAFGLRVPLLLRPWWTAGRLSVHRQADGQRPAERPLPSTSREEMQRAISSLAGQRPWASLVSGQRKSPSQVFLATGGSLANAKV